MTTIDSLITKIINFSEPTVEDRLPNRDAKVLRSLAMSMTNQFFITENQGRLLLKILRENIKNLSEFTEEISLALMDPIWSKDFRQVEQVRKLYLEKDTDEDLSVFVEFTFNSEIRRILAEITKKCENLVMLGNGKRYQADLTEKNIVALVECLLPFKFEIDEKIQNHYDTIKSWSETVIREQFLVTNIANTNFHKHITADLGIETAIDQSIINDRSMRYRYFIENAKNHGETLTEVMANRCTSRLWIDKNHHDLSEVISSLKKLRRLPLLVIFDTVVNDTYNTNLETLSHALENNGIFEKIGIYFRLPNDEDGKKFNTMIAHKQYNYPLDSDTQVVAVQSGKLPKFFLKNAWRPMSVITLDSRMGMRHGKTAVYSSCCDLIVEWAEAPTIAEQRIVNQWR